MNQLRTLNLGCFLGCSNFGTHCVRILKLFYSLCTREKRISFLVKIGHFMESTDKITLHLNVNILYKMTKFDCRFIYFPSVNSLVPFDCDHVDDENRNKVFHDGTNATRYVIVIFMGGFMMLLIMVTIRWTTHMLHVHRNHRPVHIESICGKLHRSIKFRRAH